MINRGNTIGSWPQQSTFSVPELFYCWGPVLIKGAQSVLEAAPGDGGGTHLGVRVLVEDPEHGHFSCDGLPRARGRPQQDVGVGVVECVEDLCLDGVEVGERVEALKVGLTQRTDWKRLQVQ